MRNNLKNLAMKPDQLHQKALNEIIRERSHGVIEVYIASIGKWDVGRSLVNLTSQIANEYENRFLIELIQNGYDAHEPNDTDGKINILFNQDEGMFGVLYIANKGNSFTEKDLIAITNIGQSSKNPGDSIGVKGVGFSSIKRICLWPEIYSSNPGNDHRETYDGFCFRFAGESEILELIDNDAALCSKILKDIHRHCLPYPIEDQNHIIREFASNGFATTIRLPINDLRSKEIVADRIDALLSDETPMLLFLSKLVALTVEVRDETGSVTETTLVRNSKTILEKECEGEDTSYEIIDLKEKGQYFVASRSIEDSRLQLALKESIDSNLIESDWQFWTTKAIVSVAIPFSDTPHNESRQSYTFLPMGEESNAPFLGHIQAPFYTQLARKSLEEDIHLNSLFYDVAAEICADAIIDIRSDTINLPAEIAIRLLVWESSYSNRIQEAFSRLDEDIKTADIVPITPQKDGTSWGSIDEVYRWEDETYSQLISELLVKHANAPLIKSDISEYVLSEFNEFVKLFYSVGLDPSAEVVAEWVESIAKSLKRMRASTKRWSDFYEDIATYFDDEGSCLVGKKILLNDDGEICIAGKIPKSKDKVANPTVFFPPDSISSDDQETDDAEQGAIDPALRIPASIKKNMCFMHSSLKWVKKSEKGRQRLRSRRFLYDHNLVRDYRKRELLEHVSSVLRGTKSKQIRTDVLKWVYHLVNKIGDRDTELDLRKIGLYVPVRSGWIPATQAIFSINWEKKQGGLLTKLIREAKKVSPEIADIEDRLLLPLEEWPFSNQEQDSWYRFLQQLGVQSGLHPIPISNNKISMTGSAFRPTSFMDGFNLTEIDIEYWNESVSIALYPTAPRTEHIVRRLVWKIPGQSDFLKFTSGAKSLFARLLIRGLRKWGRNYLSFTIQKKNHPVYGNKYIWPSPLLAFISNAPWIPVSLPGMRDKEQFEKVDQAWHFFDEANDSPKLAPLIPYELRRLIAESDKCYEVLKSCGLNTWNDTNDALKLHDLLTNLLKAGEIPDTQFASFKKIYEKCWIDIVNSPELVENLNGLSSLTIAVMKSESISNYTITNDQLSNESTIYIDDESDKVKAEILGNLNNFKLICDPKYGKRVASVLNNVFGEQLRLFSDLNIGVIVDEMLFSPDDSNPLLIDDNNSWLIEVIALEIELNRNPFISRTERVQRESIERLKRIRVKQCSNIMVQMKSSTFELPEYLNSIFSYNDEDYPTIICPLTLSLENLDLIASNIVELIGLPSLDRELCFIITQIRNNYQDEVPPAPPAIEDYARVFQVPTNRIREILHGIKGIVSESVHWITPILSYYAGIEVAFRFLDESDGFNSEADVITFLDQYSDITSIDSQSFIRKVSSKSDMNQLREEFSIELKDFNDILTELGPPYQLIHNTIGHDQEFSFFKQQHREQILGALRKRYLPDFKQQRSLSQYVEIRNLETLRPDPDWLHDHYLPEQNLMISHTGKWLSSFGASPLTEYDQSFPPIDKVRAENRSIFISSFRQLGILIITWCNLNKTNTPQILLEESDSEIALLKIANDTGLFDFDYLDEKQIISWARSNDIWPSQMPLSSNEDDLGIDKESIDRINQDLDEAKIIKSIERNSIDIDGISFHVYPDNYWRIIEKLNSNIAEDFLQSSKKSAKLEEMEGARRGSGKTKKSTRVSRGWEAPNGLSQSQKNAVGLAGEVLAYKWLCESYSEANPDSWRSSNRKYVFDGNPGDDSLGYDFEIVLKSMTLYFEVKTSSTESMKIHFGESEVSWARRFVNNNQYRILYIMNALDSKSRSLHILPNPLSRKGINFYHNVGGNLIYKFILK